MILWKLKENLQNPKGEMEILNEIIYLMIKNFKVKKSVNPKKNEKQREKDMKFLSRGKGNMLRWKGKRIKIKSCGVPSVSKPFVKKNKKGVFLEVTNPFQTYKYIKRVQLINKSLDINSRFPKKVRLSLTNAKIHINRNIFDFDSKEVHKQASKYNHDIYKMTRNKSYLKGTKQLHCEKENLLSQFRSQKTKCKPKVTQGDFHVLRIETKDLKNPSVSYKPPKIKQSFINKCVLKLGNW
jgi:hypothetical protein